MKRWNKCIFIFKQTAFFLFYKMKLLKNGELVKNIILQLVKKKEQNFTKVGKKLYQEVLHGKKNVKSSLTLR